MALAVFSENATMYGVTPVENMFLLEYMPFAPGDYVRVYLYALMLCHYPDEGATVESAAKALNMEKEAVLDALRYWEKKGLMEGVSDNPPRFLMRNVRQAMEMQPAREENPAYAYADFTMRLQGIFGLLHPQQFTAAIEWVEDLKLPQEVVLYMAEKTNDYCTLKNGGKPRSVPYMFKVLREKALDWAQREINTLDKARLEMDRLLPPYQLARKVLEQFSLTRNPTMAEVDLSRKWLLDWGYDEERVLAVLPETTKSARPSFAYLDGILSNKRDSGATPDEREGVKQVLWALGSPGLAPTPALIAAYQGFLNQGFAPDTLLRAAALCSARGQGNFEKLSDVLGKWLRLGLTTPEAVDEYLEKRASLRQLALSISEKAGIPGEITDARLDQVQEWLSMASPQVIEYAAQCARGLSLPDRSIARRLREYQAAGVITLEQAKAFKRPRPGGAPKKESAPAKVNPALNYPQRKLDEKYFERFYMDLDKGKGEDTP